MQQKRRTTSLLRKRVLILDGAMGTELHRRGMPAGACPEAWCLSNPSAVAGIHAAYREAGADCVYTATFGANRVKLGKYGVADVRGTNRELASIAKRAAGSKGFVAGDIGPTGSFVDPFGDLPFEEAVGIFREQALGLLDGGVDWIVIETMMDIQEARAALIAVREVCDLFTIVTITYEKNGRTLNGTDPVAALVTLQALGADAVGCNCSSGPEAMLPMLAAMKPYAKVPLVAKPNAGLPRLVGGETIYEMDAADFSSFGRQLVAAGANLVGGCCGTTPGHIAALAQNPAIGRPISPAQYPVPAVSSARGALVFGVGNPLVTVGGRLDAADNESLRQSLSAGEPGAVRKIARGQESEGADILRLKAALTGLDESDAVGRMIRTLSPTMRLSIMIDADRPETIENAIRFYPGRPMVSISGGRESWEVLLSAAARYGAVPILRCRTEGGPRVCRAEVREAVRQARPYGFTKKEIIIDLSVPGAMLGPEVLPTAYGLIAFCAGDLGCATMIDLTGIGRGLPERQWLQTALLAAAQASGLTFVVADPAVKEIMHIRAAGNLLAGKDRDAAAWKARFG